MKKFLIRLFTLLIVMGLVVTPALAQTPPPEKTDRISSSIKTPTRQEPKPVAQEIIDLFKDGMSIEEFLAANKGPIPTALMAYANLPVTVIVQLESPSLVSYMEKQEGATGTGIGITSQQSYVAELTSEQDALISQVSSAGINAVVISRYTKALNGFMARVAFKDLQTLRGLPGVKSIARAPEHTIDSSTQGNPIDAGVVQAVKAYKPKGTGVRIAIIDTGIDYTHKLLGGNGNPASYANNDPTIIEPGTFPTFKVIGGWDFAGTNYDAGSDVEANLIPVPDPDPLDENGHGTHVSSIAAGVNTGGLGDYLVPGVAPEASLYALKVFGASGSTNLVVDAIEWAMDPNQDGSVSDHVDVINMSLGSSFGPAIPDDPEYLAVEAANAAGIFVVASSGNAGDVNYVTGSPANTDSALSVASSTTQYMYAPFIAYGTGQQIPYNTSDNAFVSAISGQLVSVTDRGDASGLLCSTTGVSSMAGEIALIKRGTCSFYVKINNAEALGAVAAIIYNNTTGTINMNTSGSTLPAGSILQSDGETLKSLAPLSVVIGPDSNVGQFLLSTPAGTLSSFSSRGPRGYDSMLKPEITAPGSDIFAAQMGSGSLGISMSGTSMAAPYVAGAAALMKQVHSGLFGTTYWTNEQIKAALMNTADDLVDTESSLVPKQGAGLIDIAGALRAEVVAVGDPKFVSLNWGLLELPDATFSSEKTVTLHNSDLFAPHTFEIGSVFTSPVSAGATLTPEVSSITIPPNSNATVKFTLTLDVTQLPIGFGSDQMEEYYGYVTFTGRGPAFRLPFYFVPRPYPVVTETASQTSFDAADIGYVDLAQTGPVASNLWAYPVVQVSDNNPAVMDMADLRYVGMDYGGYSSKYGDLLVTAFNMWAPQHANQAYWSEVDLWIYGDAAEPVVDFNYNYADFSGASYPTNDWVVIQVDFNDGQVYLASPYSIGADFNSGLQEWYLPTAYSYITDKFNYEVYSYDWYKNEDFAGAGSFDVSRPPLSWALLDPTWTTDLYSPLNEGFSLLFGVNDGVGYSYSQTKGIMLVDYYGKPGIGQATYWPITPTWYLHLPIISK